VNVLKSLLVQNAVLGKKNGALQALQKKNSKPKQENQGKPK